MGHFVRAVGGWWVGAALLLVGIAGAAFDWGGLSAGFLTAGGMLIVLAGAYRAYAHVSLERDELRARFDTRFMIKAAVPYAVTPPGVNRLIIPDVNVLNRSAAPIELKFTLLAADGSGPFEKATTSSRTLSTGTFLPNPMHLDPHSSRNGRLGWLHGGIDPIQYAIAGVVLRVLDEQAGVRVDIPLPTAATGYEYTAPKERRSAGEPSCKGSSGARTDGRP